MNQPSLGPTRRVRIRLSAMTRVEYAEVLEVPASLTDQQLNDLVNQRYSTIDGSEFVDDPEYWDRGDCYAEPLPADDTSPIVARVSVNAEGRLFKVEAVRPPADSGSMAA